MEGAPDAEGLALNETGRLSKKYLLQLTNVNPKQNKTRNKNFKKGINVCNKSSNKT